jgi:hypothetical protein
LEKRLACGKEEEVEERGEGWREKRSRGEGGERGEGERQDELQHPESLAQTQAKPLYYHTSSCLLILSS